ncbi:MAG TPA: class I SAM-dependent methyltransferase [Acidobacteriota bacterium]
MKTVLLVVLILLAAYGLLWLLNQLSYRLMKTRIIGRRKWDLNICCGKIDGGGVNADIVRHTEVPNFVLVEDITKLPFPDKQFPSVLCSHTIEHVDDPRRFYAELCRVGREVTLILPPLWDISAALNILEHRWIFLTWKKEHRSLPRFVRLPLARTIHKLFGQWIKA